MGKVAYNQSGYVGSSMSMNALFAYDRGEMPKSKWTKKVMLSELATYCDEQGLCYDGSADSMRRADIFEMFFEWKAWHHTGKYANETDFYGINEDAVWTAFGSEN